MSIDITTDQRDALARFKASHGRHWKSKLVALWINGKDELANDSALLRQVRNTLGIDGLAKVKI